MAKGTGQDRPGGGHGQREQNPWAHLPPPVPPSARHPPSAGASSGAPRTEQATSTGPVQVVHVHHYVPVPAQPTYVQHAGPPHNCAYCGGGIVKGRVAENNGIGCVVAILGLFMVPFLIGIPIVLWGAHQAGKARGVWNCRQCGSQMPRQIRWYELG